MLKEDKRSIQRKKDYLKNLEWTARIPPEIVIYFLEISIEENKDGSGFNGVANLVERSHLGYTKIRSALKDATPRQFTISDMDKLASISYSFNLEDVYSAIYKQYPNWPIGWDDPRKQLNSEEILKEMGYELY